MPTTFSNRHFGVCDQFIAILLLISFCFDLFLHSSIPLATFLAISTSIVAIWLGILHWTSQHWNRCGVPGPTAASIFFGHTFLLREQERGSGQMNTTDFEQKMFKKHGKSFGLQIFGRPAFYMLDPTLLKRIFITDFAHFQDRFFSPFVGHSNVDSRASKEKRSLLQNIVHNEKGKEWRRVRNCLVPAFSTGKLKKFIPVFAERTRKMCNFIAREFVAEGKEIPLKDICYRLILAQNAQACFSVDMCTFCIGKESKPEKAVMLEHIRHLSEPTVKSPMLIRALSHSPFILQLLQQCFGFDLANNRSMQFYRKFLENLYEKRRKDAMAKEKYHDFLQSLLNEFENGNRPAGAKQQGLSRMELLSNCFIFMTGGLETSSSILHFAAYILAMLPEMQQKLRQEIDDVLGNEVFLQKIILQVNRIFYKYFFPQFSADEIDYAHLKQMRFLQAFVRETLRMFPPAPTRYHECSADIVLDGIPFRRGDIIALPMYAIQHCADFYPDPETFWPERFMDGKQQPVTAENDNYHSNSISFAAFGLGPRACIGRRFAESQIQVSLALLVRRFELKPGSKAPPLPLGFGPSYTFLCPKDALTVIAKERVATEQSCH